MMGRRIVPFEYFVPCKPAWEKLKAGVPQHVHPQSICRKNGYRRGMVGNGEYNDRDDAYVEQGGYIGGADHGSIGYYRKISHLMLSNKCLPIILERRPGTLLIELLYGLNAPKQYY